MQDIPWSTKTFFSRGYFWSFLKFVTHDQVEYNLKEIHEDVCGNHSRARTIVTKVLRVGYFWLTTQNECAIFVKKCLECQEHDTLSHLKPEWSFVVWGMDIIGLFSSGKGQTKFLLVEVDYFTKWIEVKPLASIST